MPADIFGILPGAKHPMTKLEYLDRSAFDDLAEIDLINNEYRGIYHVEGKLFVPTRESSHGDMLRFVEENMIHPNDRAAHRAMMNRSDLLQRLEELGIAPGQTTEDGMFTLDALRCIGACGIAPAVSINGKVYPKMTVSQVREVIAQQYLIVEKEKGGVTA